jgi:hypothetical protein
VRRLRLADTIEWLCAMFAQDSPGHFDDVVLLDSTPAECGRSVDTARRSALAPACAHHYSRSHSRWSWDMRLHLLAAPDGTPRVAILAPARRDEPDRGPALAWIRQRIESIAFTLKDRLGLERHRARSLHGLRARIATKLLALAAGVWPNHYLDRPTRAFAALAA